MQKELLQPLSGFRDYDGPVKNRVIEVIQKTFQRFGYQPLETPSLERQEIILGKLGEDSQKQLYLFEDNGGRKVGLRYDLTVSLARYVAANLNSLALPFKRSEIGNVWRAERAQKGRLRQFTQADADIFGSDGIVAEKELLAMIAQVDKELSLNITCLLNDRRLAQRLLDEIKIPKDIQSRFLQTIDKATKISGDQLDKELGKLGLSDHQLKQTRMWFLAADATDLTKLDVEPELKKPLEDLLAVAKQLGLKTRVDLGMVRGLEYYTGTIIEAVTDDFPSSLVGGGRYDDLVKELNGQQVPAVGISFGVDRIVEVLDSRGAAAPEGLFFTCLPETEKELRAWVAELRQNGRTVEIYLDSSVELAKQLKYAAKRGLKTVYLPFAKEWQRNQITKRDLESGEQSVIERGDI